jgi:ElaB/YqjD/DUF883 family membrane-anchored ribosome-binding protein
MAHPSKSNVSERNDDVNHQLTVLREDIANLAAALAEYGKAQGQSLKAAATEKATDTAEAGTEAMQRARAKAEVAYSDAETGIRENPVAAVGIAAGLGFLVGMIATRR